MDSIFRHLFDEEVVVHLIECLRIIQVYAICVVAIKIVLQNVIKMMKQLSEAAVS